jgi:hypothetical protein
MVFALVFSYPMLCDFEYLGPGVSHWITTGPVFSHLTRFPANGDWDLFTQLRWVPYYTITHFHQMPYWSPYKCGGMAMLGNPESSIVTPFLIPYLIFGPYAGLYLEMVLHIALGFIGGYLLARVMALGRLAALVSAVVFPSSSWLYLHLSVGHLNFLSALYLPWIAALLLISIERRKLLPAAIAGLLCAFTMSEGNYGFIFAVIVVASVAICSAAVRFSLWPLVCGLVISLFAVGFAALKMLPSFELLYRYPRLEYGPEGYTLSRMMVYVFSRDQDLYRTGVSQYLFSEYGGYLSIAFAALAALGLVSAPLKSLRWLLPALGFFLLARGDTGPLSALSMLRLLPLGNNLGLPGRFIIGFILCAGVLAAMGADFLCRRTGRIGIGASIALLVIGSIDAWVLGPPNLRYLFHNPISLISAVPEFRQYWVENPGIQTEIAMANMGSVHCKGYGYAAIPENPLGYNQTGYRGEYYLLGPGEVVETLWTPNRLVYEVNVSVPSSLVVNQNYYPGWHLSSGNGELYSKNGLLAVRIPAGRNRIELVYAPEHILLAFALTIAALAALILIWRKEAQN